MLTIAYPQACSITYLHAHQNSKCAPPVFIRRAITCDSFKVLAEKAWGELCDNQKKDPKSSFWPLVTPRHDPGQNFCTTVFYSSLPSIWYATWLCLNKMDFGPFRATPPGPVPRGYIRIPNMFLESSSTGQPMISCVKIKKRTQIPTFWPLVTPRHAPGAKFCPTVFYSSLSSIWYATWLCLHKMDFGPFRSTPLALPQGVTSKCVPHIYQNVSECVPLVLIHRAITCESFENLA